MKCAIRAVALTAALFGAGSVSQAGMINGSQGIAVVLSPISSNHGNDISAADVFSGLEFMTTASRTGDYGVLAAGQNLSAAILDLSDITTFTFGNAVFGTFAGTNFFDTGFDGFEEGVRAFEFQSVVGRVGGTSGGGGGHF